MNSPASSSRQLENTTPNLESSEMNRIETADSAYNREERESLLTVCPMSFYHHISSLGLFESCKLKALLRLSRSTPPFEYSLGQEALNRLERIFMDVFVWIGKNSHE